MLSNGPVVVTQTLAPDAARRWPSLGRTRRRSRGAFNHRRTDVRARDRRSCDTRGPPKGRARHDRAAATRQSIWRSPRNTVPGLKREKAGHRVPAGTWKPGRLLPSGRNQRSTPSRAAPRADLVVLAAALRAVRPVVVAPRLAVVAVRFADLRAEVTVPLAPALRLVRCWCRRASQHARCARRQLWPMIPWPGRCVPSARWRFRPARRLDGGFCRIRGTGSHLCGGAASHFRSSWGHPGLVAS